MRATTRAVESSPLQALDLNRLIELLPPDFYGEFETELPTCQGGSFRVKAVRNGSFQLHVASCADSTSERRPIQVHTGALNVFGKRHWLTCQEDGCGRLTRRLFAKPSPQGVVFCCGDCRSESRTV